MGAAFVGRELGEVSGNLGHRHVHGAFNVTVCGPLFGRAHVEDEGNEPPTISVNQVGRFDGVETFGSAARYASSAASLSASTSGAVPATGWQVDPVRVRIQP